MLPIRDLACLDLNARKFGILLASESPAHQISERQSDRLIRSDGKDLSAGTSITVLPVGAGGNALDLWAAWTRQQIYAAVVDLFQHLGRDVPRLPASP